MGAPRGRGPGTHSPPHATALSPPHPQAFYMVRFHSFYPWHAHGDYGHLCSEEDLRMLPWVKELKCVAGELRGGLGRCDPPPALTPTRSHSKFDLYTKQEELPDVQELRGYYQSLIDKYCPGQLCW